jgi:hypothetical protein
MNILFVTEIVPFPPNGGEKLRSYGLLKLLSELNFNIHAIIGKSTTTDQNVTHLKGVNLHPFDFTKNNIISRMKRYSRNFTFNKDLITLISTLLNEHKFDVAFIDYSFYGQYINFFHRYNIPVIFGTHNAQAALYYQNPASSVRKRIRRITNYMVNRLHETCFFRKADALIVVSEADRRYHASFVNPDKIFVIPNFLIESEYLSGDGKKDNYIIMTANFRAFQNSHGLEWFIREVWDKELWEKTKLHLVGLGSKEVFSLLKEKYDLTNVTAVGEVEDLKPHISSAIVSIVPLLHGSGSRLKCLESMALKTQLVSTTIGAEGIDHGNSIIIADTPSEFKLALHDLLESHSDRTDIAYQKFIEKYALEPNKKIFQGLLKSIVKEN